MTPFTATVRAEGATGNLRITVPMSIANQLSAIGVRPPCWARITAAGKTFFGVLRFPPSRPSMTTTLPKWCFPELRPGDEIEAFVEPATPYRARAGSGSSFDWLPFVTSEYFATDDGPELVLWGRREPFRLLRRPPEDVVWWLLGLYQAEGSKKAGNEWSLVSTNRGIINATIRALEQLGVPTPRCYLEVLHNRNEKPEAARAVFADLGPRIIAVRARTMHKKWKNSGNTGAVLHVEKSTAFIRLTNNVLKHVFNDKFSTNLAAQKFALGWLEGDGTVHIGKTVTSIRLSGTETENDLVLHALHTGFKFSVKAGKWKNYITERSLNINEACTLLIHGAFTFTMNRARLLYATEHRMKHAPGSQNDRAVFVQLEPEMKMLRQVSPPEHLGRTGLKGAVYPIIMPSRTTSPK